MGGRGWYQPFPPKNPAWIFAKPGKQPGGFSVPSPSTTPGSAGFPGDVELDCPHCPMRSGQPVRGFAEAQGPPVPRMRWDSPPWARLALGTSCRAAPGHRDGAGHGESQVGRAGTGRSWRHQAELKWAQGCGVWVLRAIKIPRSFTQERELGGSTVWTPGMVIPAPGMVIPALGGALPGSSPPRGGVGTCHLL